MGVILANLSADLTSNRAFVTCTSLHNIDNAFMFK